jgi:hypothetical protein
MLGTIQTATVESGIDVKLPKPKSNLHKTLMVVSILDEPSSAEATERMQDLGVYRNVSDVSSYLTILRSKGLVETVVVRRGMLGGSTWRLTAASLKLLNIECARSENGAYTRQAERANQV